MGNTVILNITWVQIDTTAFSPLFQSYMSIKWYWRTCRPWHTTRGRPWRESTTTGGHEVGHGQPFSGFSLDSRLISFWKCSVHFLSTWKIFLLSHEHVSSLNIQVKYCRTEIDNWGTVFENTNHFQMRLLSLCTIFSFHTTIYHTVFFVWGEGVAPNSSVKSRNSNTTEYSYSTPAH